MREIGKRYACPSHSNLFLAPGSMADEIPSLLDQCLVAGGPLTICLGHDHVDAGSPQLIAEASDVTFLVKPYLQIGDAPPGSAIKDLVLLWHADDVESVWRVEYQPEADATRHVAAPPLGGGSQSRVSRHTGFFGGY